MSEEENRNKDKKNQRKLAGDVVMFIKSNTSVVKKTINSSVSQLFNAEKNNAKGGKDIFDAKKIVVDNGKREIYIKEEKYENNINRVETAKSANRQSTSMHNNKKNTDYNTVLNLISILFHLMLNVIFYIVVVYAIMFVAHKAYDFSYQVYGDVTVDEEPGKNVSFIVSSGESSERVAQNLKDSNLIKNKTAFLIRLKLCGKNVYPDEYTLSTSMNYNEIIERICSDGVQSAE